MKLSAAPTKIPLPFATSGSKRAIPTDSQIGITAGAASLTDGFPPITFTPVSAGGVPVSGQDMNGVLNLISANTQWENAGGFFPYDSAFSTSIGGYPLGAIVARADGTGFWLSTTDDNTTDPETDTSGAWVPINNQGIESVALTSSNVTLAPTQYGRRIITFSGTLSANVQVIFPAIPGAQWLLINNTSGAYTLTCKTTSAGIVLDQGNRQEVYCDGTDIKLATASVSGNSGQSFNVADAVSNTQAVALQQFQYSFQGNGYAKLPNGLVLQWVKGATDPAGTGQVARTINWPITFPNLCLRAMVSTALDAVNTGSDPYYQIVGQPSASAIEVYRQIPGSGTDNGATWPVIYGIGY